MTRPEFTPTDDQHHFAVLGDDWWATETAWFSFHALERGLGGWFYTLLRPNIGTVAGGCWIWDAGAALPWEAPYSANYSALPIPDSVDLTDCTLPTGVSMRVLEPRMRYALRYEDADRLRVDLTFDAVMPPEPLAAEGSLGRIRRFLRADIDRRLEYAE